MDDDDEGPRLNADDRAHDRQKRAREICAADPLAANFQTALAALPGIRDDRLVLTHEFAVSLAGTVRAMRPIGTRPDTLDATIADARAQLKTLATAALKLQSAIDALNKNTRAAVSEARSAYNHPAVPPRVGDPDIDSAARSADGTNYAEVSEPFAVPPLMRMARDAQILRESGVLDRAAELVKAPAHGPVSRKRNFAGRAFAMDAAVAVLNLTGTPPTRDEMITLLEALWKVAGFKGKPTSHAQPAVENALALNRKIGGVEIATSLPE